MSIKEENNNETASFRLPKLLKKMIIHLRIDLAETCREALRKEVIRVNEERKNDRDEHSRSR